MSSTNRKRRFAMILLSSLSALVMGCGQESNEPTNETETQVSSVPGVGHDHSGWWCPEHGIPEEVCSMCSRKAADEFKAKGDWCDEHNRAQSQCFRCDPTQAEKFAKLYQAKYGQAPPERAE